MLALIIRQYLLRQPLSDWQINNVAYMEPNAKVIATATFVLVVI